MNITISINITPEEAAQFLNALRGSSPSPIPAPAPVSHTPKTLVATKSVQGRAAQPEAEAGESVATRLLEQIITQVQQETSIEDPTAPDVSIPDIILEEPAPAPAPHQTVAVESEDLSIFKIAKNGKNIWTPAQKELLEREWLRLRPIVGTNTEALRLICEQQGWPLQAVTGQVYERGLNKSWRKMLDAQKTAARVELVMPQQQAVKQGCSPSSSTPVLPYGNLLWDLTIDGIAQRAGLDYPYGTFPYQVGATLLYKDHLCRVSKVGHNSLHLTSQQSESYEYRIDAAGQNHQNGRMAEAQQA